MWKWRYSSMNLNLSTRWRWVVSFTPQPLYPHGKGPWYALDKRMSGPQSRSESCREQKTLLPLLGIEPQFFSRPISTELARLPRVPSTCRTGDTAHINAWKYLTLFRVNVPSVATWYNTKSVSNLVCVNISKYMNPFTLQNSTSWNISVPNIQLIF
jgi:hypothetical protein